MLVVLATFLLPLLATFEVLIGQSTYLYSQDLDGVMPRLLGGARPGEFAGGEPVGSSRRGTLSSYLYNKHI